MKAIAPSRKKQKIDATSFLSPSRGETPCDTFATVTPHTTTPAALGSNKRVPIDNNDDASQDKENKPIGIDLPHTKYDSIPQEVTVVPISPHQKKTVKQLKDILRKNGQHVTGKKATLLQWIADGERYGRLSECPLCFKGRLKVLDESPDVVFCPGYYDGYEGLVSCDYCCSAEDAPRDGPWFDPDKETTIFNENTKADEAKVLFQKMKVPQMKEMLGKNFQHISGTKPTLLARIVDGYTYGCLGHCPQCKRGRLKVNDTQPDLVFCPGYYDVATSRSVHCCFSCAAASAPREGEWEI